MTTEHTSLDIATLRVLKYRDKYERLHGAVPEGALSVQTRIILNDFGRWLREHAGVPMVDLGLFPAWFKSIHPAVKDEGMAVYTELFKRVAPDVSEGVEAGLVSRWVAADSATKIAALLEKWNAGEEMNFGEQIKTLVEDYEMRVDRKVKSPQVLDAIEELLKAEENDEGIHWPYAPFNKHIKPMVGGDFVVVAMRPDKGKTTLCSEIVTFAAPQIDVLFPDENRSILWMNNEGPGKRIVMRNFQSALNATVEDLVRMSNEPSTDKRYKTKVREEYAKALGGRMGVLRVMDIHGMWNYEVEDIIRAHKPALIVFDMIDNIRFGGEASNNGSRTDQLLEAMYQWARLIGVKYDCAIIANSQVSADGDGLQFPTLPMLKDSKTGKQGAADVIITGGAVNDPMLEKSRYFGTTKNKRSRTGQRNSPQCEMILDGDRGRYVVAPS